MNQQAKRKGTEKYAIRLSDRLGMRFGVRYVVTRDSKHREFQAGDRVWMEPDGSIICPAAQGWMPPEDVLEATEGWAIEPYSSWERVALNAIVRYDQRNPELCVHAQSENDDRDLFCYISQSPRICKGPCGNYKEA